MASLCKRQQCTIDRRGFRQELDSWRHKLIHCVGFESILEGLFGTELLEDLQLYTDREPVAVSDWSFDENCIFCCLRRDKVKEHLTSLNEGLEDPPKPLLVKDQTLLIRLERQAEEFLTTVFKRKDVPNFLDPHVPVVAREILQRMIRQFATEYTSKTSPSQDSSDSQPHTDQSLPTAQSFCTSPAPPPALSAHNQNPVLSKLLMVDQDAPLDLTIKRPPTEPSEQDGVLDLSIKKPRHSSFSPGLSPVISTPKGRSLRADGGGLLMRSRQDGRRENLGHSALYKPSPSISYSLHIKEEEDADSTFLNGSRLNGSNATPLKLKTNDVNEHLKDLPKLLQLAGLLSKSLAGTQDENGRGHLSAFDLKIPQVRVTSGGSDQPWDSFSSSDYSGLHLENGLEKGLHSILPRNNHKKHINGLNGSALEKEYWSDRGNSPLDSEADLSTKQPRKKRGRYRQYNTELLEEAILVVMSGKMSVSKAQSVYGIPHSTLEYKVKEQLGTLKNPPKKKLRRISQVEEQEGSWICREKEALNTQGCLSVVREQSTDSEINNASLSPHD